MRFWEYLGRRAAIRAALQSERIAAKAARAGVGGDNCHRLDKLGLFLLAGLVVIVLGVIVVGTYWTNAVPDKGDVLLGGIATGLILFLRDLVAAVRAGWEEVTRGKVNEQLAAAGPAKPPTPPDAAEAADQVATAAEAEAERIGDRG
jgi:hypothetical protein